MIMTAVTWCLEKEVAKACCMDGSGDTGARCAPMESMGAKCPRSPDREPVIPASVVMW